MNTAETAACAALKEELPIITKVHRMPLTGVLKGLRADIDCPPGCPHPRYDEQVNVTVDGRLQV